MPLHPSFEYCPTKNRAKPYPMEIATIYIGVTIKYKKLPPLDGAGLLRIHKRRIFMRYRQNIYYCPVAIALCDGTGKKYKGVNED